MLFYWLDIRRYKTIKWKVRILDVLQENSANGIKILQKWR
jgi:hypothetical protein